MSLGRPLAIPDNHVQIEMPRPVQPESSTNGGPCDVWSSDASLDFYNASLYVRVASSAKCENADGVVPCT